MKPASLTVIVTFAAFMSFSSNVTSSNTNITLALGAPQYGDARADENTNQETLILSTGEPLNVLVKNLHEQEVFLPATGEACAVITVERLSDGAWHHWSSCEFRRHIKDPIILAPGEVIEGTRSFRVTRPISKAEVLEGPLGSQPDLPTKEILQGPTHQVPVEKEVQQTINTIQPPVPFFEKFSTLPAGDYLLATSYAFSSRPEEIRYVKSMPFSVIDRTNGQN